MIVPTGRPGLSASLVAAILVGTMGACAHAPVIPAQIPAPRAPEARALPPVPEDEARPPETPAGNWVEPLEAGACLDPLGRPVADATRPCPLRNGIAVSEERAWRDGIFRVRYRELRALFEADRAVWAAQREFHEARIRVTDDALRAMVPNWWERNALPLGLMGGFALGVALVVSVVALAN